MFVRRPTSHTALLLTTAIAGLLGSASFAQASNDTCSPSAAASGGTVTCGSGTEANGIHYDPTGALTLNVAATTVITGGYFDSGNGEYGISVGTSVAPSASAVTINNSADVTYVTDGSATAIAGYVNGGNALAITNSGALTENEGIFAQATDASLANSITITNTGAIAATDIGISASGSSTDATTAISVTNSAAVSGATGIQALITSAAGETGTITIQNQAAGTIDVTGTGILAQAGGGGNPTGSSVAQSITITNAAAITAATGIAASSLVEDEAGTATITVSNSGGITTTTGAGISVAAETESPFSTGSKASATVTNTGAIASTSGNAITAIATGNAGFGVNAPAGTATTTVTNDQSGASLSGVRGIDAEAFGYTAKVTVQNNDAAIQATQIGIYAYATADGTGTATVGVTNSGEIVAYGGDAIHAEAIGSTATVTVANTASFMEAFNGSGIYATTNANEGTTNTASTTVTNAGHITISGGSPGIQALSYGYASASVDVENQAGGTIGATGATGIYAYAESIGAAGHASAIINNAAEIRSGTASLDAEANTHGFSDSSTNTIGTVQVTNTAALTASSGSAIYAGAEGSGSGSATVTVTNSAAGVINSGGNGINAFASTVQDGTTVLNATVTVTNDAQITAGATGIAAQATAVNPTVTVTNSGAITATNGIGIDAEANGPSAANASDFSAVTVINNVGGTIMAGGTGILAYANFSNRDGTTLPNAAVTVTNSEAITAGTYGIDAEAFGTVSTVAVTNSAAVSTTSRNGIIAYAYSNTGSSASATITNTGSVNSGDFAITAYAGHYIGNNNNPITASASLTSSGGAITGTSGGLDSEAYATTTATASVVNASTINALAGGIYAEADFAADGGTATVMVKNDGAITSGRAGIDAEAYTDTSNISGSLSVGVVNTGAITSSTGTGIYTEAEGTAQAGITVSNTATIQSHDAAIYAYADVYGAAVGGSTAANIAITNSGALTSTYSNADTIDAEAYSITDATITVDNGAGGTLSSQNVGIYAYAAGPTSAAATVTNAGSISAVNSYGIYAEAFATAGGTASIVVQNTGDINARYNAIYALAEDYSSSYPDTASVAVTNTANLTTTNGNAIDAEAYGTTTVTASVTTSGTINAGSEGIYAEAETVTGVGGSSAVTIGNSGTITANNDGLDGEAYSTDGSTGTASATITNTGSITSGSEGIYAEADGDLSGTVTVSNTAAITASNDAIEGYVYAAYGNSLGAGTISITNSGALTSTASGDDTIDAQAFSSNSAMVSIQNTSTGTLNTQAKGIFALASATNDGATTTSVATTSVANAAGITAGTAARFYGIDAEALANGSATVTVTNSGAIQAANGINAVARATAATLSVTNSGAIQAAGGMVSTTPPTPAYGIKAQTVSATGLLTVNNSGALTVNSTTGPVFGISAIALPAINSSVTTTADVTVTNDAAITVSGMAAATTGAGVFLQGNGTVTLNNSSTITATNVQAAVVFADQLTDPAVLNNTGTIENTNGIAVVSGDQPITITNYGVIKTDVPGGIAIQIGSNTNTLVIETGSSITGYVINGTTTTGVDANNNPTTTFKVNNGNTLALGGPGSDTFNLDQVALGPNQLGYTNDGDGTYSTPTTPVDTTHQYQGFHNFLKSDAGTWTLTGATDNDGAWAVQGGTLVVDGSIANSAVTVGNATLGGSGTIGTLTAGAGAVVAPGAGVPYSTLTVNGNVTFQQGSTYRVGVNADGRTDLLTAGGVANLSGATLVVNGTGTFDTGHLYTILTAAGGTDGTTFASVTTNSQYLLATLTYDPNDAILGLKTQFQQPGQTSNQTSTAGAVDTLPLQNPVTQALLPTSTSQLATALSVLSSDIYASGATTAIEDTRLVREAILTRMFDADREEDAAAAGTAAQAVAGLAPTTGLPRATQNYAALPTYGRPVPPRLALPRFAVWGDAFGDFGSNRGNGAGTLDRTMGGFVLGGDTRLDGTVLNNWRIGVVGGYTNDHFDVNSHNATGVYQTAFGGVYGTAQYGAVALRLGATAGGTWTDVNRTIAFANFFQGASSHVTGNIVQGFGELGYKVPSAYGFLEPVVGGAAIHYGQDGFRESAGAASLIGLGRDYDVQTVTAGIRAEGLLPIMGLPLTSRGFLGYRHAFGDVNPNAVLAFQAGAANFTVEGAPITRDAVVTELGVDYHSTPNWTLGVAYSGQYGARSDSSAVKGKAEYRF